MLQKPRKRLSAVWSRDVNFARLAGRTRIIAAIREEMAANYQVENLRLHNLLERRGIRGCWGAIASAVRSTVSGSLPSLQCLLFCDRANHKRLMQELKRDPPEILYLDGVRTFYFLKRLKVSKLPMRIVVDLDDLMSRRMEYLGHRDLFVAWLPGG